jgi:hypothetical protein
MKLGAFARESDHGRRYKQTIYRLLLLRQLGVTPNRVSSSLSSTAFSEHCRRFLLVSGGPLAEKTGGDECYFVPTTCQYPKATGGSDWAIGTMWTRCDVWKRNGIIEFDDFAEGQRRIRFCREYVMTLKQQADGCLLPALPLAIFLLRNPQRTRISLDEVSSESDLMDLFLQTFNLMDSEALELFDLTTEKVPSHDG